MVRFGFAMFSDAELVEAADEICSSSAAGGEKMCWNMKISEERVEGNSKDQLVALAGLGYKARLCGSKMLDLMEERTSWNI